MSCVTCKPLQGLCSTDADPKNGIATDWIGLKLNDKPVQ